MAIFKKIIKNLAIVLGIVVGLFFVLMAIMYFGNVSVFGLKFKKAALNDIQIESFNIGVYQSVTMNIGNVDLDVVSTKDGDVFKVALTDDCRGLCKSKKTTLDFTSKVETTADGKKNLIIDVQEPEGWLSWKNTAFTLTLNDELLKSADLKIIINASNGNALINTTKEEGDTLNYVYYKSSEKGGIQTNDLIKNIDINTKKGDAVLNKTILENVNFNSEKGELFFEKVGSLNAKINNGYVRGSHILSKFIFVGDGGKIDVDTIGNKFLPNEDLDYDKIEDDGYSSEYSIYLAECNIAGKETAVNINNLYAKLKLSTTKGIINVESFINREEYDNEVSSTNGKIIIDNIYVKKLSITSLKGDIDCNACGESGELNIYSDKGKIEVELKGEYISKKTRAAHSKVYNDEKIEPYFQGKLNVKSNNGLIKISEVKCLLNVESINKGNIEIKYLEVNGANSIKANKGKVKVFVPISDIFTMNANSTKGKVNVKLDALNIDETLKKGEGKIYNIGGGSQADIINISSNNSKIYISQI